VVTDSLASAAGRATSGQAEIVSSWTGRPSGPSPRDIGLIAGMNLWLTILQDSAGRISLGRLDGPGSSARGDESVRHRGSTVRHGYAGRRVTVAVPVDPGRIEKGIVRFELCLMFAFLLAPDASYGVKAFDFSPAALRLLASPLPHPCLYGFCFTSPLLSLQVV
jgi:hypothetical protein